MTNSCLSGESFVNYVFSPTFGVLTTKDVDGFLVPNNLTFTELLLPFCQHLREVSIKDVNGINHIVKRLNVRFESVDMWFESLADPNSIIQPSLYSSNATSSFVLNGRSFDINVSTPWFETWRNLFLTRLGTYEHEFLTRCLGCLFVVSTRNPDPLAAFADLMQKQEDLLRSQRTRWFSQANLIKFFVLVNDPDMMSPSESNNVFKSVSSKYGNANCYFLNLGSSQNSRNTTSPTQEDIWRRHLPPGGLRHTSTPSRTHGEFISELDRENLRSFVQDFVNRILITWVEMTIRQLNEQTAHRLRKPRGFFSVTRKLFAPTSVTDTASVLSSSSMTDSSTSLLDGSGANSLYPDDAPELQMRRLADLLFLFQLYEPAHQIYDLLKRDFKQKQAWLHYAGTQEMSALSTYLQGAISQRQYPQHQMDDAILQYVTKCKNHDLALRALLLHTEALKSRELFAEMAVCLIRLADVNDFLTGGLLLEQAAYCSLRGKRPLVRHFAMRMALAGVRFSRAKQPYLSARSFALALEILSPNKNPGAGWSLALDHVNENLARQQLLLHEPREALQSFWPLISPQSNQLEAAQTRFLRHFIEILNQVNSSGDAKMEWPELSIPVFAKNRIKVLCAAPVLFNDDDSRVEARGVAFSDDENDDPEDAIAFANLRRALPHNFATHVLPGLVQPHEIPAWMLATDEPSAETWKSGAESHVKRPGEDFVRLLYASPSHPMPRQVVFRRLRALLHLQAAPGNEEDDGASADPMLVTSRQAAAAARQRNPRWLKWPSIPVGEQLTVQIPLHNSWRVPLVLTDVHLLWQALFSTDSQPGIVVSNEDVDPERLRLAKTHVHASVISEFYLLPGDHKVIELSLQPRRITQELLVTGIAFKLGITSPRQSAPLDTEPSPLPTPQGLAPNVASALELLTSTPQINVALGTPESSLDPLRSGGVAGRTTSVQGKIRFPETPDPRFHWNVVQPRALLKVMFGSLPQCLYENEVFGQSFILTNVGSRPLVNVHLATSWPGFFVLANAQPAPIVSLLDKVALEAGHSRVERFWIRAPATHTRATRNNPLQVPQQQQQKQYNNASSWRIHMVFAYATQNVNAGFRYLQHEAKIQVMPSLRFSAVCARTQGSDVDSLIVTLRCKNTALSQSFAVVQLACMDSKWDIHLMSPASAAICQGGVVVPQSQEITLCIRATRRKSASKDGTATVSSIVLHPEFAGIDPMSTPHSRFFQLTSRAEKAASSSNRVEGEMAEATETETDLAGHGQRRFSLVAFWRVEGTDGERIGQSHIPVTPAHAPRALQIPRRSHFGQMLASIPSLLPISSLLRLRLHHPPQVVHDFTKEALLPELIPSSKRSAMAIIPVTAEIYNASTSAVTARISTNEDSPRSPTASQQPQLSEVLPQVPRVLWTGPSVQQVVLAAGETHRLALSARAARPGVYEVNSFCLKAATVSSGGGAEDAVDGTGATGVAGASPAPVLTTASAPFVRQFCDFSSLVVVLPAVTS